MNNGYLHVYTGNGKGKTTAAIGLAIRAAGAGKKVLFTQFLKSSTSSEHTIFNSYRDKITTRCFGTGEFVKGEIKPEHIYAVEEGLDEISLLLSNERYDLVVLDEIISALNANLISADDLLDVINERPLHVEMVLTGRAAPSFIIDAADLVTEMVEVKHYFHTGVMARKGIEY